MSSQCRKDGVGLKKIRGCLGSNPTGVTFCHWIFFHVDASDVNIVTIVNVVNLRKTRLGS